jgi:hypothetical protein
MNAQPRDAKQFLQFLTLLNPKTLDFTFQTLPDNKSIKDPSLTRVIQSPAYNELTGLHARGAGSTLRSTKLTAKVVKSKTSFASAPYGRKTTMASMARSPSIHR